MSFEPKQIEMVCLEDLVSSTPNRKKVIILGSGPNRIGQGIKFDYTCFHAAFAFKAVGIEAIMVNCNPKKTGDHFLTTGF